MKPNLSFLLRSHQQNTALFESHFTGLSTEQIHWRPAPEKWNLLEILCHLLDEEREDFRSRLKHVLEQPLEPMPPIRPVEWVKDRNYAGQDFQQVLNAFRAERKISAEWILTLENAPWENFYQHPKVGPLNATLFLHNWIAHDLLHLRQIANHKLAYLKSISPDPLDYAGFG